MHYLDLREQTSHGTPDFPFAFYRVQEGHPRYDMPFHWHKEWELIRILKGRFTCYINGEQYPAKKGDFLFITQGALHGGTPEDCVYECAVFDPLTFLMHPESCRSLVQQLYSGKFGIPPVLSSSCSAFFPDRFQTFFLRAGKSARLGAYPYGAFIRAARASLAGVHILEQNSPQSVPDTDRAFLLKPVLEYIDRHYMQQITLEELAHLTGMPPVFLPFFQHLHPPHAHRLSELLPHRNRVLSAGVHPAFGHGNRLPLRL